MGKRKCVFLSLSLSQIFTFPAKKKVLQFLGGGVLIPTSSSSSQRARVRERRGLKQTLKRQQREFLALFLCSFSTPSFSSD